MGLESKFVAVSSTFFEKRQELLIASWCRDPRRGAGKQVGEETHGAAQGSKLAKRPTARRRIASWRRGPWRGRGQHIAGQ